MTITVNNTGGNTTTTAAGVTSTSGSFTSISGSTIVGIGETFQTSGAAAGSNHTDSKTNTYQLAGALLGGAGACGISAGYNIAGTRGTTHTVSYNAPGAGENSNSSFIEFSSNNGTMTYDSTTFATNSGTGSTATVTSAASVPAGSIVIVAVVDESGSNVAISEDATFSLINEQEDGTNFLCHNAAYKIGASGSVTHSWTLGTSTNWRALILTFQEPGGGPVFIAPEPLIVPQHIKRGFW